MKNDKKRRQFVVIGLGIFGSTIATTLYEMGKEVLCIDEKEELVQAIADQVTHAIQADAREETVLASLGIENFDVAIVGIGNNLESSLMVTLALKEAGVSYIIAKATNDIHERALYKIGADRVIQPEKEMGRRVGRNLSLTKLIDYIELSEEYSIFEITCPDVWVGKTLIELNIRRKFGVTILGLKRNNEFLIVSETIVPFAQDDVIILLGSPTEFYKQFEALDN